MRKRNNGILRIAVGVLTLAACLTFLSGSPGSISYAEEVSPSQKALIQKYFQTVDSNGNVIQDDVPFVNDGKNSKKTDTSDSDADNEQGTGSDADSSGQTKESGSETTPSSGASGNSEQAKTSETGKKSKQTKQSSKKSKNKKTDNNKKKETGKSRSGKDSSGKLGKGKSKKAGNKLILVDPSVLKLIGGVLAVLFVLIVINFSAIFVLMKKKKINGGKENAETQQ